MFPFLKFLSRTTFYTATKERCILSAENFIVIFEPVILFVDITETLQVKIGYSAYTVLSSKC